MPTPVPVSKDFKAYRPQDPVTNRSRFGLVSVTIGGMLVIVIASAAVLLIRQFTG